jgi:zinc transport system substrate-binding protein
MKGRASESPPCILVSVGPHEYFVKRIAGDTVKVEVMVPVGASAHTYEPSPKQMLKASQADIWFCIGEGFEAHAIKAIKAHHPQLAVVDLRQNVDMISADPHSGLHCCHANGQDLHIWLSARQAQIQAKTIAEALCQHYPANEERYQAALILFLQDLDTLDQEIAGILENLENRTILVSHPAYAYFCRDYGLNQLSIEVDGKDPTPRQLNTILNQARSIKPTKVYTQMQYSSKGAKIFARELGAKIEVLEPYSENIIDSMRKIARSFASQ